MSRANAEFDALVAALAAAQAALALAAAAAASGDAADAARARAAVAAAAAAPAPATGTLALQLGRPRVGVGCILLSTAHRGRALVGERRGSHGAGTFALPGGHLEFGQSFGECASMELLEECGLTVDARAWTLVGTTNNVMGALHYVTLFVAAVVDEATLATLANCEPDKCAGWSWIPYDELHARPLFPPLVSFLADARNVSALAAVEAEGSRVGSGAT
jgi:8-oxo-dGTP diphosphatase